MMTRRELSKPIKIGNIIVGGSNKVAVQSMCDIKTSKINQVVEEILLCEKAGADLMRISVLDIDDAKAIKKIKEKIHIPLVADIHLDYKLGIESVLNGADKIRINPGNIGSDENLSKLIEIAKEKNIPIRIGVNLGSLSEKIKELNVPNSQKLVISALEYVNKLEKLEFYNIVISVKASDSLTTLEAYRELSEKTNYPLHLGVTESGYDEVGIIRSVSALSPLLLDGIGSTIRISLSQDPIKEIKTCIRLLHDLGLYKNYPTIISCPTCGRTQIHDLKIIAEKVLEYLEQNKKNITVAIMGCVINGIGEGKNADIGIAGGKENFVIFEKGKIVETVKEKDVLKVLFSYIDKM